MQPFEGIRVIDATHVLAGPFAAYQLGVLGANLPSVQVSDLQIHPRDHLIVISTYGRGMWVMDARKVRALK